MAHHFETGFFVAQPAWHKLGTVVESAPSVVEAFKLAGLDWDVEELPLFADRLTASGVERIDVTSKKAIIRNSDASVLGVVGKDFAPWQNRDAFAWFEPLVADGTVTLETAGSLFRGRKVWVLARYAQPIEVKPGDVVQPYLLVAHGHDGTLAVNIKNTPVRVVCNNTLSAAGVVTEDKAGRWARGGGFSIRHVGDVAKHAETVREQIVKMRVENEATLAAWKSLARIDVDTQTAVAFAREVFDAEYLEAVALLARIEKRQAQHFDAKIAEKEAELRAMLAKPSAPVDRFLEAFETAPGADLAGSTAWGLLNAATYMVDHRNAKNVDSKLDGIWFGEGARKREKATELAYAMIR